MDPFFGMLTLLSLALLQDHSSRDMRAVRRASIPVGTKLYHGSPDYLQLEDVPDGPAWFSTSPAVARAFSSRRPSRVFEYEVVEEITGLLLVSSQEDFVLLFGEGEFEEIAAEGNLELAEAVINKGFGGWIVPQNYPEGDDILLDRPEHHLQRTGRVQMLMSE